QHLVDRNLVVAVDVARRTKLAQEVDEIVGEAVVVIDEDQHGERVGDVSRARQASALGATNNVSRPAAGRTSAQSSASNVSTARAQVGNLSAREVMSR